MPIAPNGPNGGVPPAECSVSGQKNTTSGSGLTTMMQAIYLHIFFRFSNNLSLMIITKISRKGNLVQNSVFCPIMQPPHRKTSEVAVQSSCIGLIQFPSMIFGRLLSQNIGTIKAGSIII